MAGNAALLLAGIAGSGTAGNSLAYFAPYGNAAPTSAAAAPPAGFLDAGWVSEKGLVAKVKETSKDIRGYGSFSAIRKVVTASDTTFDLDFLESNTTSLSIYNRKPLTGTGSLTAAAGLISFGTGASSMPTYAAIFDLVDGVNLLRAYCPDVQVTDRGDFNVAAGDVVSYPVVLSAYPDSAGNSVYWYYSLDALILPTVATLSPTSEATHAGGTSVTLTGTHLSSVTAVKFGTVSATAVSVLSNTSVSCVSPAQAASGAQVVTAISPAGTSTVTASYTYTA
jgi:hypothetical protein